MNKIHRIAFFCFALITVSSDAQWNVREIPDPNLPDIAMVTVLPNGEQVIIYNPILCQQAGPLLCGFYRAHEYCHIDLGHVFRPTWPQVKELEADCCAAKVVTNAEANAAYQWFISGGGTSPTHGFGPQRAQRILACRN